MNFTFIHLGGFVGECRRLKFTLDDARLLELQIAADPARGAVIGGTGGLRKIRFSPISSSAGKSGAVRVGYAVFPAASTIYLVTLFAKNEKANLTAAEKNQVRSLLSTIGKLHS